MSSNHPLCQMWSREVNGNGPLSIFVGPNGCIKCLLLGTKDLRSLVVKVMSVEFFYLNYAMKCYLENA